MIWDLIARETVRTLSNEKLETHFPAKARWQFPRNVRKPPALLVFWLSAKKCSHKGFRKKKKHLRVVPQAHF